MTTVASSKYNGDSGFDGGFSQLDEGDDLRPLGHRVEVRTEREGAREGEEERREVTPMEMDVPRWKIGVRTDVKVETEERLVYNDRLY